MRKITFLFAMVALLGLCASCGHIYRAVTEDGERTGSEYRRPGVKVKAKAKTAPKTELRGYGGIGYTGGVSRLATPVRLSLPYGPARGVTVISDEIISKGRKKRFREVVKWRTVTTGSKLFLTAEVEKEVRGRMVGSGRISCNIGPHGEIIDFDFHESEKGYSKNPVRNFITAFPSDILEAASQTRNSVARQFGDFGIRSIKTLLSVRGATTFQGRRALLVEGRGSAGGGKGYTLDQDSFTLYDTDAMYVLFSKARVVLKKLSKVRYQRTRIVETKLSGF